MSDNALGLWERELEGVDAGVAVEVGHHAFLKLADHISEIDQDSVGTWLGDVAKQAIEGVASAQWRRPAPYLGRSRGALEDYLSRAEQAVTLGVSPERLALRAESVAVDATGERAVSMPWRSGDSTPDLLPTPDSVWRGRYMFNEYTTDLVLLDGATRRLLGTISPAEVRGIRPRGSTDWMALDDHGRFRIEPLGPGPHSIEVDTPIGVFATEWTLL